MSINIPSLDYGTVIGRFLIELADSSDADLKPDVFPASGYAVFTPGTTFATINDATPDPAVIFPQKVIGVLDSQGYLCTASFDATNNTYAKTIDGEYVPTRRGVSLQATDDMSLNPNSWTWRVDFYFNYRGSGIKFDGFNFSLPTNSQVDLTLAVPIETNPGEYTVVGPQGPRGERGDPGPSNSLSIGTVTSLPTGQTATATIKGTSPNQTLDLSLPAGPVGPSGGPIPAGGTPGDSVMKGENGSTEWRFTDGIQDNLIPNGTLEYRNTYRWDPVMVFKSSDAPPGYSTSMWCPPGRSASTPVLINDLMPVVSGDEYILEIWIKANKPDSVFYLEMRDQTGEHAGVWTWDGSKTNPANAYPIGQYTVPTEWTKIVSRGKLNAGVTSIRLSNWYFNHSSGTERGAEVGVSGVRLYRAPSPESLSSSVGGRLPSGAEKSMLSAATASNINGTLAKRDSVGGFAASYLSVSQVTPAADTHVTSKKFVEDRVTTETRVDLFSNVRKPLIISHRGGPHLYPEESMEGFIASMESGYAPEMDIQFLSDGTPVCCHDSTVTRTMTGISGAVSANGPEEWRTAKIKPAIKGGNSAKPVFFEDVLDRLGGRILLVAEIKTGASDADIDRIINLVKSKRLEKAVLLQSFAYTACQRIASAGLKVVYLLSSSRAPQTSAQIKASGIEYIGPSKNMTNANITSYIGDGFKVVPYTVNSPEQLKALPAGIHGYFSDDPWWTSGELQMYGAPLWERGTGWPYRYVYEAQQGSPTVATEVSSSIIIQGNGIYVPPNDSRGLLHIGLDHLTGGPVLRPLIFTARIILGKRASSQSTNAGFTLFRNINDPEAIFYDTATPGQEGMTFAFRRSGIVQAWKYDLGQSAVSLGSATDVIPVAPEDQMSIFTIRVEMKDSWIGIHCPDTGKGFEFSHTLEGPLRPLLRTTSTEATFYDVQIGERP